MQGHANDAWRVVVIVSFLPSQPFIISLSRMDTKKDFAGAVVTMLYTWLHDAQMTEAACYTISCLVTTSYLNNIAMGETGACKAIVLALQGWGQTDLGVALRAVVAVTHLAKINSKELGAAGACQALVTTLQAWGETNEELAYFGCMAIDELANLEANALVLVAVGARYAIAAAVARWNKDVECVACSALTKLEAYPE